MNNNLKKVLVVDYGSQTTQLIIRRVREIGMYCEMITYNICIKSICINI